MPVHPGNAFRPARRLGRDARVFDTDEPLRIPLGEGLLGCVIDPLGRVIQGRLGDGCELLPLP